MRLNAYVMAADPAWIEASVLAYYDLVREIVVSYDEDGLSWTGTPLDVDQCLRRLRRIDSEGKLRFCPGHFSHPDRHPMENDTCQRQCALHLAARDADWVIQLDTDEVLGDPAQFMDCLEEADRRGFTAMDYPARWLFRGIGGDRYLERCSRFWGTIAGFTGSVAVRPGVQLRNARQCDIPLFRVDYRNRNTDPWRGKNTPVHRAISPMQGIFHYSWVREEEELLRKTGAWGHSQENWAPEIRYWKWAGEHPRLAMLAAPFLHRSRRMRIASIPQPLSVPTSSTHALEAHP